jgi:hypothetical protein
MRFTITIETDREDLPEGFGYSSWKELLLNNSLLMPLIHIPESGEEIEENVWFQVEKVRQHRK